MRIFFAVFFAIIAAALVLWLIDTFWPVLFALLIVFINGGMS